MLDKKIGQLFFSHVKILQNQLEHLLEKEPLQEKEKRTSTFQASTASDDLNLEMDTKLATTHEKVLVTFSQLAPYFESGLLFHKDKIRTRAVGAFDQGDFFPLKGFELEVSFSFPEMSLVEVRRVQSKSIFSELKKLNVVQDNSDALIFSPHPEYIFLVTSKLAEPWLRPHIEKIQAKVLKKIGDL